MYSVDIITLVFISFTLFNGISTLKWFMLVDPCFKKIKNVHTQLPIRIYLLIHGLYGWDSKKFMALKLHVHFDEIFIAFL